MSVIDKFEEWYENQNWVIRTYVRGIIISIILILILTFIFGTMSLIAYMITNYPFFGFILLVLCGAFIVGMLTDDD